MPSGVLIVNFEPIHHIYMVFWHWDNLFKHLRNKICGRQPLQNLEWHGLFKQIISLQIFWRLPQILLGPFFKYIMSYWGWKNPSNKNLRNVYKKMPKTCRRRCCWFLNYFVMRIILIKYWFINHLLTLSLY